MFRSRLASWSATGMAMLALTVAACDTPPDQPTRPVQHTGTGEHTIYSVTPAQVGVTHNRILQYIGDVLDTTWVDSSLSSFNAEVIRVATIFAADSLNLSGADLTYWIDSFSSTIQAIQSGVIDHQWLAGKLDSLVLLQALTTQERAFVDRMINACIQERDASNTSLEILQDSLDAIQGEWTALYGSANPDQHFAFASVLSVANHSLAFWSTCVPQKAHKEEGASLLRIAGGVKGLAVAVVVTDIVGAIVGNLEDAKDISAGGQRAQYGRNHHGTIARAVGGSVGGAVGYGVSLFAGGGAGSLIGVSVGYIGSEYIKQWLKKP